MKFWEILKTCDLESAYLIDFLKCDSFWGFSVKPLLIKGYFETQIYFFLRNVMHEIIFFKKLY